MKLKGSFTLEGAVIFPMITMLIIQIVMLDFLLHNKLLGDVCKIMGAIRYHEAEAFYYDSVFEQISLQRIVCSPVLGKDEDFITKQKSAIDKVSIDYYMNNMIGTQTSYTVTDISKVIDINDNAAVVHAGGKIVQIIGGD